MKTSCKCAVPIAFHFTPLYNVSGTLTIKQFVMSVIIRTSLPDLGFNTSFLMFFLGTKVSGLRPESSSRPSNSLDCKEVEYTCTKCIFNKIGENWLIHVAYPHEAARSTSTPPDGMLVHHRSLPTICYVSLTIYLYSFIVLGGERQCESQVSCSRTQHNVPS